MARVGRNPRRILVALSAVGALLLVAPVANAGILVSSATNCDDQVFEQPFLPWADPASYVLAPGGTVENGTSLYSLSGAAGATAGNEPYYVHGSGETTSLSLPAGSSATTGSMCVGIEHPTLRFFAKRSGGSLLSSLRAEVLFEDAYGNVRSLTIGSVTASSWTPTVQMPVVANLLPLLPGERTAVAFRFTPVGSADWAIDDIYVDPYRGH